MQDWVDTNSLLKVQKITLLDEEHKLLLGISHKEMIFETNNASSSIHHTNKFRTKVCFWNYSIF